MKKMTRRKTALLCTIFFLQTSLFAQEKETELDPVSITTSFAPERVSKTGRNIFVIKGERFNQLPIHSIDELLRYLPGVEVQARGPMGSQSDIVLRGGTFQQVLVIVDGMRINDPNTGHFTSYIPISPAEIDRIEILKGAASAIYGSEAVGGVIHIITKTFGGRKSFNQSQVTGQVTGGQYGLFNAQAGAFYSNGKTVVGGGILTNNAEGQLQRGTRGFFHNHTGSFSLSHQVTTRLQLSFRGAVDQRKFAAQNFYTTFASDTASERVRTIWSQVAVLYKTDKSSTRLSGGFKWLSDQYTFNSASAANISKSRLWQVLLTNEWKLLSHSLLTTGTQFISKQIASNDRGDHNVNQAAAFAIWNQTIGDNFFVSPALRVEWNERSGWQVIPQANVSFHKNAIGLRASAGKTIRDADFTERFNNYNKPVVSSGRIGNPDLQPERSFSYEGGVDIFAAKDLKISATYFRRNQQDLIDYVTTPYSQMPRQVNLLTTGNYALAKNIAEVTTEGVETDVHWNKKLAKEQELFATLGFVYLKSSSNPSTPSFYISSHAKYLTNFTMLYANRHFAVSVNGLYKERVPQTSTTAALAKQTSNYFVLNAKGEGFIVPKKFSVFIQADNVFDTFYTDLLGSQMPGRWLMAGLHLSLTK